MADRHYDASVHVHRRPPPFQLVEGDQSNLSLGLVATFFLASCRHLPKRVPLQVRWQLNAYTNWNLTFLAIRYALRQRQWEPFLLVNSVSIVSAFRTAFAQGLDENMRKKLAVLGLRVPRRLFVILDHLVHTGPVVVLLLSILTRKQRVHPMNSVYVLMLYTWFSFRQADGQLDVSNVYVPHPWKRAWAGVLSALVLTPKLVDALNARKVGPTALYAAGLLAPWLASKLDPELKRMYNFECMLHASRKSASGDIDAPEGRREQGIRRRCTSLGLNLSSITASGASASLPTSPHASYHGGAAASTADRKPHTTTKPIREASPPSIFWFSAAPSGHHEAAKPAQEEVDHAATHTHIRRAEDKPTSAASG